MLRSYNKWVLGLTISLFAFPLFIELLWRGFTRVFTYFAPDTFYYLVVARNFASLGFFTFDEQFPTNGFHPLWQSVTALLYLLGNLLNLDDSNILVLVMLINITLISIALFLLGKSYLSESSHLPIAFLLLPIGVYPLLVYLNDPRAGSMWNNANGMESSLVLLAYAAVVWAMVQPSFMQTWTSALIIALLLSALFLARLDHAFFVVAFGIIVGIRMLRCREWHKLKYLILSGTIVLAVLAAYLLFNQTTVGSMLPVSGGLKSTFPRFLDDKFRLLTPFLLEPFRRDEVGTLARLLQIILPALPAIAFLGWSSWKLWKRTLSPLGTAFAVTALGVIILAFYNWNFVPLGDQGNWYFPVSILFMSLLVLFFLNRSTTLEKFRTGRWAIPAIIVACAVVIFYFISFYGRSNYRQYYANYFANIAPDIVKTYGAERIQLVEFDDGIIGFSTRYPTMSGLGFTLDVEGVQAKSQRSLLKLAYERGFDRLASMNYFNARELSLDMPPQDLKDRLGKRFFLNPREVDPFSFQIEYLSPDNTFAIIKMTPQEHAP